MEQEFVVVVRPSGAIEIGPGVSIGQVLAALEAANKAVLGVVLRPVQEVESVPQ